MSATGDQRPENEEQSLAEAADADNTLEPGSEPGGPDYDESAAEGRET